MRDRTATRQSCSERRRPVVRLHRRPRGSPPPRRPRCSRSSCRTCALCLPTSRCNRRRRRARSRARCAPRSRRSGCCSPAQATLTLPHIRAATVRIGRPAERTGRWRPQRVRARSRRRLRRRPVASRDLCPKAPAVAAARVDTEPWHGRVSAGKVLRAAPSPPGPTSSRLSVSWTLSAGGSLTVRPPCPLVINITLLRLLARPGRPGGRLSLADTEHATLPLAADPPSRPAGGRRRARASAGVRTLTGTAAGVCTLTGTAAQWAAGPAARGKTWTPAPQAGGLGPQWE